MREIIKLYSRKDIQREIIKFAKDREVVARFSDSFGKRPDVLYYESDVLELAKQGATSFHMSVERWKNPLDLKSGLTRRYLDGMRAGWDLTIDIDSPFIEYSKAAAYLVIEAIKYNSIDNISLKFSGGSGMHILVPFESFPKEVNGKDTVLLFPEIPKAIIAYIKYLIEPHLREAVLSSTPLADIAESLGKKDSDLFEKKCDICNTLAMSKSSIILNCKSCGRQNIVAHLEDAMLTCVDCGSTLEKIKGAINHECPKCGNTKEFSHGEFNPFSIIDIDTQLISSRHMIRAPYTINEKTNLVSIPIDSDDVKKFNINRAKIQNVEVTRSFFSPEKSEPGEARKLFIQALEFAQKNSLYEVNHSIKNKKYEIPREAVPEKYFPECIHKLLRGVQSDGRKRGIFILIAFLQHMGWSYDIIETMLLEWNKKNYEPLRDGYILTQLRWFKQQPRKILPPNCNHESYYMTMGIKCFNCKCKNPVNFVRMRLENIHRGKKKK